MHDQMFANAFRQPSATVLKLPMLDFTIGHELLLWNRMNPVLFYKLEGFKELPTSDKASALAQAAMICYNDKDKSAIEMVKNTRKWVSGASEAYLDEQAKAFYDYREAGSRDLPTSKQPKVSGVPYHYFGAPELARLINYVTAHHEVMIKAHFDGSPLSFPFGLARMLYSTHLECEGSLWIQNYQDVENKTKLEQFEKANPESTLAVGEEAVKAAAAKWNKEHPECPIPE